MTGGINPLFSGPTGSVVLPPSQPHDPLLISGGGSSSSTDPLVGQRVGNSVNPTPFLRGTGSIDYHQNIDLNQYLPNTSGPNTGSSLLAKDAFTSSSASGPQFLTQGTALLVGQGQGAVALENNNSANAETKNNDSDPDEDINVTGDPPSTSTGIIGWGGGGGGEQPMPPPDDGSSIDENITVVGKHGGYDHVVLINSVYYMDNGRGGIISDADFRRNADNSTSVTVTPIPLAKIDEKVNQLDQTLFGAGATDDDRLWISQQLVDGQQSWSDIWSAQAHSGREHDTLAATIHDVQDRNAASSDDAWISSQEDALSGTQTYQALRDSLIDFSGEEGILKQDVFQNVHERDATDGDIATARGELHSGLSIQQVIWNEAHNQEATADINSLYQIAFGREADNGGLQTYQDAIGNGQSLENVTATLAGSEEAKTHITSFLNGTVGSVTDDLVSAGQSMVVGISNAYQYLQDQTSDGIQSLANGYQATFGSGNVLQSVMPNTWEGWLGLTANLALVMTPPGDAVVAGEVLAVGGEELLTDVFQIVESRFLTDIETKSTQIISEDGRQFIIDDVAKRTAPHAEKHIDESNPNLSLRNNGINNVNDIENYIRNTLNEAPNNPGRYEIASDIKNSRLAIWDKENNTITIFNPKGNSDLNGFGTVFKPGDGYNYFIRVTNAK